MDADELIFAWLQAVDDANDHWLLAHWSQFDREGIAAYSDLTVDAMRLILAPAAAHMRPNGERKMPYDKRDKAHARKSCARGTGTLGRSFAMGATYSVLDWQNSRRPTIAAAHTLHGRYSLDAIAQTSFRGNCCLGDHGWHPFVCRSALRYQIRRFRP